MNSQSTRYFARVTAGTEAISWLEMETLLDIQRIRQHSRTLEFFCSDSPAKLLLLRSVDDVYIYLGTISGLNKTNPSLASLAQVGTWDLASAIEVCRQARSISSIPSYAITASLETPCNYSRFEAAEVLHRSLEGKVGWRYINHRDNQAVADLDLRLIIKGVQAILGMRLGRHPLHRRLYKQASVPGSLKPPIAFSMLMLANPRQDEVLIYPLCGASTIPFEAESNWSPRLIIGSDISGSAIAQTKINAQQARSTANYMLANAFQMPFADRTIDKVCSNLPWGRQVELQDPDRFHTQFLTELQRVLRPVGRAVLLTDQVTSFTQALAAIPNLNLVLSQQISLYGSHPTLLVLIKQVRQPDLLHPFSQYRDEEQQMNEVVQTALLNSLKHPDESIRLKAAKACHRSQDIALKQALAGLADDPSPAIRALAKAEQAKTSIEP